MANRPINSRNIFREGNPAQLILIASITPWNQTCIKAIMHGHTAGCLSAKARIDKNIKTYPTTKLL